MSNLITFTDILVLKAIVDWEQEGLDYSIPIRGIQDAVNRFIEDEQVGEDYASPVKGIWRIQESIRRWKLLEAVKQVKTPAAPKERRFWYWSTPRGIELLTQLTEPSDWRLWPKEIELMFTDRYELDWGRCH